MNIRLVCILLTFNICQLIYLILLYEMLQVIKTLLPYPMKKEPLLVENIPIYKHATNLLCYG